MKSEKLLSICQKPSDIRRYLETHSKFLEAILSWTESHIYSTIYNIITPQHTWYPSANKALLDIDEKISMLNQHISYINIWKLKSKIYETLDNYKNLDIANVPFNELSNKISINQQLISWIFKDWPENLAENIFGKNADQRFEQERLWLSSQVRISRFHNNGSEHTIKQLPEWYCSDKDNLLYKWDTTLNRYMPVEMYNFESSLSIYDYDEELWIFVALCKSDAKKGNTYKILSFQKDTISEYDTKDYLDVRLDKDYMAYVESDGLIRISMKDPENKIYRDTIYTLPVDEENINDINDIIYNKDDNCIITLCINGSWYSFYLIFEDWTVFSDLGVEFIRFRLNNLYSDMVFENWKFEYIADADANKKYQPNFLKKLLGHTRQTPEYLSIQDEGLVHKIDLHKLHTYLQNNTSK